MMIGELNLFSQQALLPQFRTYCPAIALTKKLSCKTRKYRKMGFFYSSKRRLTYRSDVCPFFCVHTVEKLLLTQLTATADRVNKNEK